MKEQVLAVQRMQDYIKKKQNRGNQFVRSCAGITVFPMVFLSSVPGLP